VKRADGRDYFEELLARIRDIRSSEKVFWKKVLDIYATSHDYDGKAGTSVLFFKTVQNKMHFAAHGHTAAEVLDSRAFLLRAGGGTGCGVGRKKGVRAKERAARRAGGEAEKKPLVQAGAGVSRRHRRHDLGAEASLWTVALPARRLGAFPELGRRLRSGRGTPAVHYWFARCESHSGKVQIAGHFPLWLSL